MPAPLTALLVGGKSRPKADTLAALVTALWEEEIVAPRASVSVGPVTRANAVVSAKVPGKDRQVAWTGTDLRGLLAALRSAGEADVAVWFDEVDLDAFEPAEEEEYEDVEDEGEEGEDDDGPPAPRGAVGSAVNSDHDSLGEFDMVPPSMCLYSVKAPIELGVSGAAGPRATWIALSGEDVPYFADDLGDSLLRDVVEESLGAVKIAKLKG